MHDAQPQRHGVHQGDDPQHRLKPDGAGQGEGAEAERQREVLAGLNYSMFRAADDAYLDPVREMVADQKLAEARTKNDQAGVAAAERELAALRAKREVQP